MMRVLTVLMVVVLLAGVAVADPFGYDYEAHQRPLWRTVSVDTLAHSTDVFVHSQPYTLGGPDGTKNPIQRLRLLYVTTGESRFVTAMPKGANYRVGVVTSIIDGETDARLQERIVRELTGDFSLTPNGWTASDRNDLELLDLKTARYESDRVLNLSFVVTRFRGYDDDEQRFVNKGKSNPKRLFNEFAKVEVRLPDHEYRYLWIPEGKRESKASAWLLNPETEDNLQLERLIQATFNTQPLQQVRSHYIPDAIRIYCAYGLLWEGSWGEVGKVYDPYAKPDDDSMLYQKRTNEQGDSYFEGIIPKADGGSLNYLNGNSNTNSNSISIPIEVNNSTNNAANNTNIGISNNNAAAAGN